jgi:hypothetical protein
MSANLSSIRGCPVQDRLPFPDAVTMGIEARLLGGSGYVELGVSSPSPKVTDKTGTRKMRFIFSQRLKNRMPRQIRPGPSPVKTA